MPSSHLILCWPLLHLPPIPPSITVFSNAGTSLKSIFTTPRAYGIALGKLVLYPLIPILLLRASGILSHRPELVPVLMVTAIAFAAPAASNVSQLAVVFDQEPTKASIYNILTLFFCVVTIPLFIGLYQLLFS